MPSMIRPTLNMRQQCRWHGYTTTTALENAALQAILTASQQAILERNTFHIVLAGGSTPRQIYELIRTQTTDWNAWHIYFGDERCLPADHPDRNSSMATQAWLSHVDIPLNQIHLIPAEQGPERAATIYAQILNDIDMFDLVLLGLGEDGHTASLFPHHEWGTSADAPATLAIYDAPKSPPERVSLSARRLSQSRQVMFLITGAAKRQAVQNWRNGNSIPATAVVPHSNIDVYLEKELL